MKHFRSAFRVPRSNFLRWLILGATLFFLAATLHQHWQAVMALQLRPRALERLAGAIALTLLAHGWSGWVWSWILQDCGQPASGLWATRTYLRTNIAKYLPGNIWHFYGRVRGAAAIGVPTAIAVLSVVLEALLMAAAALLLALASGQFSGGQVSGGQAASGSFPWQGLALPLILLGVHPRCLTPVVQRLSRGKLRRLQDQEPIASPEEAETPLPTTEPPPLGLRYPLRSLLGEVGFVFLRGLGWLVAFTMLQGITPREILPLLSGFSWAWLLGLVVPGAPGGLGVFEATAIALLSSQFAPATVLGAVACYRLVSTLAEAIGAGLAGLQRR